MEADYTRKTQDIAEQRKAAETFNTAVEPFRTYIASLETTPEQAFTTLMGVEYQLRMGSPEQKAHSLAQLAQAYRVDLSLIPEPDDEDEPPSPEMAQVNQRFDRIERAIVTDRSQAETQVNESAAETQIFS